MLMLKKVILALQTVKVWKGNISEITVGISKDLIVTVPRGTSKKLSASLVFDHELIAPLEKGSSHR